MSREIAQPGQQFPAGFTAQNRANFSLFLLSSKRGWPAAAACLMRLCAPRERYRRICVFPLLLGPEFPAAGPDLKIPCWARLPVRAGTPCTAGNRHAGPSREFGAQQGKNTNPPKSLSGSVTDMMTG
jgi:hypothetical protein